MRYKYAVPLRPNVFRNGYNTCLLSIMIYNTGHTNECINKESLLKNLPYPLFAKDGSPCLPLAKGGKEGFYNQFLHTYDRISNCLKNTGHRHGGCDL
jgi:hypothetical protein